MELSELFPLTFWKHLDRLNVQEQRTPRWSFLINSNGIQCNIYWENKTEEEKISEEAAQGGLALKKADQWLKDAQNANLENLSPDEINKTVQSILSFFSPLNNNNKVEETKTDSADELVTKLQTRLSGQKRKAPPPTKLSKAKKVTSDVRSTLPSETPVPSSGDVHETDSIQLTCTPVMNQQITIGQKLVAKKLKPTILPNGTLLGQVVSSGKGKKILCYVPTNLKNNVTVKIPIKSDKNFTTEKADSSLITETTRDKSDEEIIKIEPLEPEMDSKPTSRKEIKLKISS